MLAAPLLAKTNNRIDASRISVITDECSRSQPESIAFAKQYGLKWIEVRDVPGLKQHYMEQSEDFLKSYAADLKAAGVGVSFFNSPMLKITLPGTEPKRNRPETPEAREKRLARDKAAFERRFDDLAKSIRAAQILGCDKLRVFTFLRVEDPKSVEDQVANIVGEMGEKARKEGVWVLVENEGSCNAATSQELGSIIRKLPEKTVALNWDPMNGMPLGEKPWPEGYESIPAKRIANVQIKGRTLLEDKYKLDWPAIFTRLADDGYPGKVGLETHIFGDVQVAKSHESMKEILRIVQS